MAVLPPTLDLSISLPGSSGESGEGRAMRNLDINQVPEVEPDEDEGASSPPRKKLRLSKDQSRQLEESFRRNQTLNPKRKEELAMGLKLKARQVEVWFQNRRARSKLKQTEMECEYLKRWFGSLTERNRRLQNEVERLRALRSVGPTNANNQLASASMCPRCERVISNPGTSSSTSVSHVTTSLEASENLLPASRTTTTHQQTSSAAC